jgi:hypothetical protein
VSMWRSGLDSASPIARRCQVARSKAGSCEVYVFRGLSRVGKTPIRSGACRRHTFLNFSKSGAEVPGPCIGCCRKKPRNLMATIALVDPSKTVLIRWSNSCATIAPSARDLRGAQSEQAMDGRGLIGHKTALKHL